jgi:phytoene synthase
VSSRTELAAAGIEDPVLQEGYLQARRLNAQHGKTYYLATLLLPADKRPYVHALYGFARHADDIVDNLDPRTSAEDRASEFGQWSKQFLADLGSGTSSDPISCAVIDTINRWRLSESYFADFLHSMQLDLTVTEYQSYSDLVGYMWGSAAVIGLQVLPILGYDTRGERDEATIRQRAGDLGLAFQLTNFIRDLDEDLARGRIYLPQESLQACGVDRQRLERARREGRADRPIQELLALEIERARSLYRSAAPGIEQVDPTSRDCLRTALTLYSEILNVIERSDYQVFGDRATVAWRSKVRVAGAGLVRAGWARRRSGARLQS